MKLSKQRKNNIFVYGAICYFLSSILLFSWYSTETRNLRFDLVVTELNCLVDDSPISAKESNNRRLQLDRAMSFQSVYMREANRLDKGKWLLLFTIIPLLTLVLTRIGKQFKTRSLAMQGTVIVLLLAFAGVVLETANYISTSSKNVDSFQGKQISLLKRSGD